MSGLTARRLIVAFAFAGLLAAVYMANYLVEHVGIIRIWPGHHLRAPAGVYMAGLAFLFRDTVQRLGSVTLALLAIGCGALLSPAISPPLRVPVPPLFRPARSPGWSCSPCSGAGLCPRSSPPR